MTTNTAKVIARLPGIAARNIQAIWSNNQSANMSKPAAVPNAFSAKDRYCADRATD